MITPENTTAWIIVGALLVGALCGVTMIGVSARSGWISKQIKTAAVVYGFLGVVLVLSPQGKALVIEWQDFKAQISALEKQKNSAMAQAADLHRQIELVSSLGLTQYPNAGDAVDSIKQTRNLVEWAKFLPGNEDAYRIQVSPDNKTFATEIAKQLNTTPDEVSKVFDSSGYTVLKRPSNKDLQTSPANQLWITPRTNK